MADWILTAGLQNLRSQVNAAFPGRDRTSDGTIGDAAHQAETSSHNPDDTAGSTPEWNGDPDSTPEVRAWDMDSDLHAGVTAQQLVDHLRALSGLSSVIRYMIYNRRIYRASNGWAAEDYSGPSAHTEHVHFTGAFTQAADNNTTFDYRLGDLVLTNDDVAKIVTAIQNADINPDPNSKSSLSGALWTILGRSNALNDIPDAIDALPTAAENAQAVLAALGTKGPQEIADALRAVLGDQAAAVGALLAAS
jgi:hypothetical protein